MFRARHLRVKFLATGVILLLSLLYIHNITFARTGITPSSLVFGKCWAKTYERSKASQIKSLPHAFKRSIPSQNPASPLNQVLRSRLPVSQVNCSALLDGDREEQDRAEDIMVSNQRTFLSPQDFMKMAENCKMFRISRGYFTSPLSPEEENFSIAFSIIMYQEIEQVERLLRAIYRPQNVYCIHVDRKSPLALRRGVEAITNCFDNVIVIKNPLSVDWGQMSVLEADLLCMRALSAYKKWKYFINLTGQEFPLRTNRELVKILQDYKGANNIEMLRNRKYSSRVSIASVPPHGIKAVGGSLKITASRGFVDYVLHNQTAQDFLQWVKNTEIPDEIFFQSLNANAHLRIPGTFKGNTDSDDDRNPQLSRFVVWYHAPIQYPCEGKFVREVCVFGVRDLPMIILQPHLFVNKFHLDYQQFAQDCLEEWHFNRTRDEFLYDLQFDDTCYKNLDFVINQVHAT
ncbi:beta-1,3-galactosyl-O-glycosyl-glycoprotein beta-1,6-N-acetylglucosaminyltransferase-like [Liolophura sinensis]|uniref:beta-1,3-galactosyl-O-glycosyl-glycoprotein beta-1,6-N-acetylglucosaminyltransferase-like n=1 Tax=Liolophura sinensis TaxID=3198878 RepID=UPI003159636C